MIKKTNLSVRSRKDLQKHNCDLKTTTWKGNSRDNEISRKSPLLEIAPFKSSSSQSLLDDIQFESECRMEISDYIVSSSFEKKNFLEQGVASSSV